MGPSLVLRSPRCVVEDSGACSPTSEIMMEPTKIPVWRQRASCRGVEPDIFYPVTDEEAEDAKEICYSCSVRERCLEWALTNRERDGVWGGATERERRRMIRQRRRSA
jgi:WhiB family redox-sensing transcriptional regulator